MRYNEMKYKTLDRSRYGEAEVLEAKSVPDKHQKKIAIDTVKNPSKSLLGGPSEKEAIEILKSKFKYSDADIKKLQQEAEEKKKDSGKSDTQKAQSAIKTLIDSDFGGSNEEQYKASQMIVGLSGNDSKEANSFMSDLDKLTNGMDKAKYGIK